MKLSDKIFFFLCDQVDNHNILPDEDQIYTAFQKYFELQDHNPDVIAETVQSFVGISDLTNVEIKWEGEM
jgi:hypothetical protein